MQNESRFAAHLRLVEAQVDQARKQVDASRQQLAQAERISQFWGGLLTHLRDANPSNVLLVLRREAEYIRSLANAGDPAWADLEEIRADAEAWARASAVSFGRDFPDAIRQAGLEIDSTSRHPKYTFKQGFVRVLVDDREFTAKVSCRDGVNVLIGMDVGPLVATLQREIARIFDRKLDADVFLRRLYTAYAAILRAEGRPEGEEVPLRRVMNRMAKNISRFVGDEFNVDLAQLVKSGSTTVDGLRMHLNHTRNARLGVLLHGLESGGYVGFISFKKES